MKNWWSAIAAAAMLAIASPAMTAPAEEPGADDDGIQAYSVARLRVFSGSAWVRTPDSGEWDEFATNSPIPERARISVPDGSEAEVQFHAGQGVLLTAGSEIDVRQLGDERSSFRLRSGEIRFDLPEPDFAPVVVRIPGGGNAAFPVPGRYWLTARDDGETRLVVRSGRATVSNDGGEYTVTAGNEAMIGADVRIGRFGGEPAAEETPSPLSDAERDAGVPPSAAHELRDYGEWVYSDEYGWVWRPRVADGWSPYFYGRWDWVSPYGWVWVSFEPWGWWPYHYGYWYSDPFFGWVWCPYRSFVSVNFTFGSFRTRHYLSRCYFAPATVRFTRDGRHVRWIPLRPGERGGRIPFTRSDSRLAGWERPLSRGTVFVRQGGEGSRVWRDYSAATAERRPVVRESAGRGPQGGPSGLKRGRDGHPAVERPAVRGGVREERRQQIAPRPERMDREHRPGRRSRDSGVENRYGGGGGAAPAGTRRGRDSSPGEYGPGAPGSQNDRLRAVDSNRARLRREAPAAAGSQRRLESAEPRSERRSGADTGRSFSPPRLPGGSGGRWERGGGRERTGFEMRGGDWRGGRGGR